MILIPLLVIALLIIWVLWRMLGRLSYDAGRLVHEAKKIIRWWLYGV
ncbi:hypothetical protein X739_29780 [Mesorhizobium sp. LNHC220B00]|nr:hypothetical protein X739_29780 [Mesorhizobium sp. LNHC220B00]ESY84703.1 hypothetical protein X741_33955 [Mesorhizobium sp. LNHC229A00]